MGIRVGDKGRGASLRSLLIALILCVLVAIPTCIDLRRSLPNGYRVVFIHSHEACIINRDGLIVFDGDIVNWKVHKEFVEITDSDNRVFLFNTKTGEMEK
jgi:hypothetical protein